MEKQYIYGDLVHFYLDNSPSSEGRGTVVNGSGENVTVRLTTRCKEFNIGDEISVGRNEMA